MLKAILAALGYSEAEIENTLENRDGAVSEDAVKAKLAEVFSAAKSAQTQAETAKTAQDEAEKKLADAQTAAANERAKFAEYVVNGAIKAGKLTEADRAAKTQALVDSPDIVAAANEIDEAEKKVETASETDDLKKGDAKAAAKKAFDERVAQFEAQGDDHATATVRARREMPEQYKLAFEN